MEEFSRFVIREQNQLFGAGPFIYVHMWVVGASFQA
jgi:hypothetical protein